MKKRILSIVLAVLMLLSVLPVTAMAADGTTGTGAPGTKTAVGAVSTDGAIHVNKSVVTDAETGETSLKLEAYLTNKVIQTTSTKPLDIVLVLDQSGSMAYDFNGNNTSKNENRRQYAMKQAVNAFIGKVNKQYSDKGNHQMAIVTFGTKAERLIGWTAVNDSGKTQLTNAINSLPTQPEGATDIGLGMKKAQELMRSAQSGTDRQKIVIVFTDGVPTRPDQWGNATEFRTDVANEAISAAKAMKDAGTIVYTVGIFNGADPKQLYGKEQIWPAGISAGVCKGKKGDYWQYRRGIFSGGDIQEADIAAGNRFLNYLSSNYNASEIGIKSSKYEGFTVEYRRFDITEDTAPGEDKGYYLTARNANGLTGAFQTIIQENSTLEVKAGTSTILSDTLSQYFTLNVPAGQDAKRAITAEKWDCTDKDENGYTWVKAATQPPLNVEVSGKTIKVNGFDYTQNAVTETVKEVNTTFSGSKLVVTIPIKPDTGYTDWQYGPHDYPTNDTDESKAGLSYGENGEHKLELDNSPLLPVTGYKVTYQVNSAEKPDDYTEVKDDTVYIKGQEAPVQGAPITNSTSNGNEQGTWEFIGWKNGGNDAGKKITINGDVTLTGEWKFTKADKYGVTYTYVSSDPTNHPLPSAISTPDGTGDYAVSDATEYYVDAIVTRKSPAKDTYEDTANKGTWTLTWDNDKATMTANGVTFTGTWTFTADAPTEAAYIIEYYKMKADGTYGTTPDEVDDAATNVATIGQPKTVSTAKTFEGYAYDESYTGNVVTINPIAATDNVFKLYYKANAVLSVRKTVDKPTGIEVGDTLTYTITVRNTGKLDLTTIEVTDTFKGSGKLDFTGCAYEVTENGNVYTFTIPTLAAGTDVIITATYKVVEGDSGNDIKNAVVAKVGGGPEDDDEIIVTPGKLDRYNVSVPVVKKLINNRSDFDGETFEFEISYTNANGREVVMTLRVPVGKVLKGETATEYRIGEFTLSEADYENLPKDDAWYHGDKVEGENYELPYIMIHEVAGSTEHMSYANNWVKAYLVLKSGDASALSLREPQYTTIEAIALAQPDAVNRMDSAATFVNEYVKKTDDKEVKPAKVGPQLNRDDHVAYIMGYPDGTVQPEGQITRAEACTIFFRLLTDSSRDYYFARTNDYSDVNAGDWFNNAISTLSNAGIVTGYNDGTFRPNQPITRGEMAKIIANFANLKYGGKTFTDLAGHWSKSYVELAAGNGWIAGYPDGSFRPDQKITRAETVTMINRVLDRVPAKESRLLSRSIMLTFPDNNPGDWYYIAIQEASNSHEYRRSVYETTGDEMWTKLIDNVDWTKLEK